MTIEISPILRVRAVSEAAFGTDETGSLGGFTDVAFRDGTVTWTTDREMLDPMTGKQRIDEGDFKIPGWRRGTLTMTHNLAPTGVAAVDTVAQVQSSLGLLLKIGMGGEDLGTGSTVGTPTDAGTYTTAAQVGNDGSAQGLVRVSNSRYEMRGTSDVDTTVELKTELGTAPLTAAVVHGTATYYLTKNPSETAQFVIEGAEADDGWVMLGCQLDSMSIDVTAGQIPTITLAWKCASYLMKSEAAGTIGAAAVATLTNYQPIIAEGDLIVRRTTTGATLPALTCIASFTMNFGLTYADVPCPSGVSGIKQYRRIRSFPVASGSYQTFYEDETAWTDRDAKEPRAITYQLGITAGYSVMLEWPYTQVVDPQRVDGSGLVSQSIGFEAHLDGEAVGTTDLAISAFRIHFG